MSSKPRKRSRAAAEEKRADCPFEITMMPPPSSRDGRDPSVAKKRKNDSASGDEKKLPFQTSPFEPAGKFRNRETMDIHYSIEPRKNWTDMTRYNSFVLNGNRYLSEEFIFVANDEAIERQKAGKLPSDQISPADFWVARILEIRAQDEHHVYARVFWMYSPDELPAATLAGKKTPAGRQAHHGVNELVASNHMDVINVVSVVQPAKVNQWIESEEDEVQDALYWRQAFDCHTQQLSPIDLICRCQTPANPDKTLVGCTNSNCEKWMHLECLREDVLKRVYDRLGNDLPHVPPTPPIKKEDESPDQKKVLPQAPLSPPKDEQPEAMIAVGGDANADPITEKSDANMSNDAEPTPAAATILPHRERPIANAARGKAGRGRKSEAKLYLELFEATLRMNEGPMVWEIKDLRQNVVGGVKEWTEAAICLLCDSKID